jgi:predicted deacylase
MRAARRYHASIVLLLALCAVAAVPPAGPSAPDAPPTTPRPRQVIEIGSARAAPGRAVRGTLPVLEDAGGSAISLPVVIVAGRRPGPVVWAQASAHGDEYGGPRALQEVIRTLDPQAMSGTLVAVLVANPPALAGLQRVNPNLDDLADMGDVFPGRDRFATERIAAALTAQVSKTADYFVDLHTGGDRFRQHPFVFYTLTGAVPEERYDALARGFGLPTVWRDTSRVFPHDAVTTFSEAGIPAFLLEVGGGQPLRPADVALQADAVRGLLRTVGILPGPARPAQSPFVVTGYRIVTNRKGGFFEALVEPGDRIADGRPLGRIVDVYGDVVETLTAPAGARIVLGVSTYPAAPTGAWLLEVGTTSGRR